MKDEILFSIEPDGSVVIDLDSADEAEAVVAAVNPGALEAFRHAKHGTQWLFGGQKYLCG